MECLKCKTTMFDAQIKGDLYGLGLYLTNKKKGLLESEKRTAISCFVCPNCGYIELKAETPQVVQM